ncbi:MAG TPA: ABC transporter permease [Chloroflexota bacterium]|nr:ABC transporter permease [Chloroflexota bacterium]
MASASLSTPTERLRPAEDGLVYGLQPPKRAGFRISDHPLILQIAAGAIFLGAWEVYGRSLNPIFLASPTAIAGAFVETIVDGELLAALIKSLQGLAIGFALAVVVGIGLGVLMGRYKSVNHVCEPFITIFYATPSVALIPLIMLWFGLGLNAKIVIIFESCFFPIVINTHAGVRNVSRATVDVVRAYGATDRQIMTKVVLPSAVPFVMAGIRLAVGRGVIGMVVAEFFTALSGLGSMIIVYSNAFNTAKLFVPVITIALMGLVLTNLAKALEQRMAPWKESERAD